MTTSAADYIAMLSAPAEDDIPGWFNPTDALLMQAVDELQGQRGTSGDILEVGVYQGKSAILLGFFPRAGERLVVCDVFEYVDVLDTDNTSESAAFYDGLDQATFERNYLRFHRGLPVVHARPSAELDQLLPAGSCRLVHIDGSHTFDVVRRDIATARRLLGPGGVVVFDDWSSSHVPGVAMAFWQAYADGTLVPLACSRGKFYATWDTGGLSAADLDDWVAARAEITVQSRPSLGRHRAGYVTMTPDFWRTYSAGFFAGAAANGRSAALVGW